MIDSAYKYTQFEPFFSFCETKNLLLVEICTKYVAKQTDFILSAYNVLHLMRIHSSFHDVNCKFHDVKCKFLDVKCKFYDVKRRIQLTD